MEIEIEKLFCNTMYGKNDGHEPWCEQVTSNLNPQCHHFHPEPVSVKTPSSFLTSLSLTDSIKSQPHYIFITCGFFHPVSFSYGQMNCIWLFNQTIKIENLM